MISKSRLSLSQLDFNFLLIGTALLIGLILRVNNLGGAAFWNDEIHQAWTARNILTGEGFYHPDNPGEFYSRGLLFTTLPSMVSFSILGYTEFAGRLPSVLVGMLSVILVYILSKELLDRQFALISSFMMSLSYWAITWHTQLRMYAHLQFLYLLSVLLFYRWYKKDFRLDNFYPYLLGVIAVIGYNTHLLYVGVFAVFFFFIAANLAYEKFRGDLSLNEELSLNSFRILVFFVLAAVVFISLQGVFTSLEGALAWFYGYTPDWYSYETTVFYYLSWLNGYVNYMFLFAAGLVISFNYRDYWLISLPFLVPFILQSVLFEYRMPRLIFHIYPFFLMIASLPLYYTCKWLQSVSDHTIYDRKILLLLTVVFVAVLQSPVSSYIDMTENSHGMAVGNQDHRGPVEYIQQNKDEDQILISEKPAKTDWYLDDRHEIDYGFHYHDYEPVSEMYDSEIPIIEDSEKLAGIVSNNSGYFILDVDFPGQAEEIGYIVEDSSEYIVQKEDWRGVIVVKFD